jgi:hypothetical protein
MNAKVYKVCNVNKYAFEKHVDYLCSINFTHLFPEICNTKFAMLHILEMGPTKMLDSFPLP